MELPRPIYETWLAVADRMQDLHNGSDDDRRTATKRGVQTIRARHKGGEGQLDGSRWVCKSEHNTAWHAQSKDAIAYVPRGEIVTGRMADMEMFDMINGGDRKTHPFPVHSRNHDPGEHYNPTAYILVPEEDYDWLKEDAPEVPRETHRYIGGGNDIGMCDQCGLNRFDPVHAVPEAEGPHTYDGGEHDTGFCDLCQKAKADAIHNGGDHSQDALAQRVGELETILRSAVAKQQATAAQVEALIEKVGQGSGGAMDKDAIRAACETILSTLEIDIEVQPNGQGILRHGHGDKTTIRLGGREVARLARQAPAWEAIHGSVNPPLPPVMKPEESKG